MAVKRTISFLDLDGNRVEEDWYFALDESDAADTDIAHKDNLETYLSEITKNKDSKSWLGVMKELLFAAVGRREGKLLVKGEDILRDFKFGGAYKQLFSELIEMEDAGAEFFASMMSASVQKKIAEEQNKAYSKEDMLGMTDEEFFSAFGKDETSYSPDVLLVAFQRRNSKAA